MRDRWGSRRRKKGRRRRRRRLATGHFWDNTRRSEGPLKTNPVSSRGWSTVIVAAPGPSLTEAVAEACRGQHVIAVNRAYLRMPFAEVLYCGDRDLVELYEGFQDFEGEKWAATHEKHQDMTPLVKWGFQLVSGPRDPSAAGFCLDPHVIHYGGSGGYQAINRALPFGRS